ncbi:hypothetical protein KXD96_11855 [Mycobacterium sp. SMC-2]|uniref:hypothetical protein n=1 Tax=Mycobacterium sp. SMC-2 TaxID=2857058 RepID=UPI0021B451D4|nr:hypothetical protein [Mycobacterium sp. SMC-2]UXA08695.1 hypothetical protein KXD96_11855 [Mycobacterium sp. SMC-2]
MSQTSPGPGLEPRPPGIPPDTYNDADQVTASVTIADDRDPDGSYDHCVSVSVLGFGGTQCYRVCPPDPSNPSVPLGWTPGMVCPFRP